MDAAYHLIVNDEVVSPRKCGKGNEKTGKENKRETRRLGRRIRGKRYFIVAQGFRKAVMGPCGFFKDWVLMGRFTRHVNPFHLHLVIFLLIDRLGAHRLSIRY